MKKQITYIRQIWACRVKKQHKEKKENIGIWEVVHCENCHKMLSIKKVKPSFIEIYDDVMRDSGNQVW